MEHKHCPECRGSYGYHYPSCSHYDDELETVTGHAEMAGINYKERILELEVENERLNSSYSELSKSKLAEIACANEQYKELEAQVKQKDAVIADMVRRDASPQPVLVVESRTASGTPELLEDQSTDKIVMTRYNNGYQFHNEMGEILTTVPDSVGEFIAKYIDNHAAIEKQLAEIKDGLREIEQHVPPQERKVLQIITKLLEG